MSTTEPARPARPSLRMDEVSITSFRTFGERTRIPLRGPGGAPDAVAVFHGDNGTGKSNAMAALDLFFQTVAVSLTQGTDEGEILIPWDRAWDIGLRFSPDTRPLLLAYQDRPHGSEVPMEVEVAFEDARLGRIRATYTPSGPSVRVRLERAQRIPDGVLFTPVPKADRDQLATWLSTPHGPQSFPLTILDARRRPQWHAREGHRSLMPLEITRGLFDLQTSRSPGARESWRQFVAILHRFAAFRGKDISMEQRPERKEAELVVEERGRTVLTLDELSSGEQQVVVLSAASVLAGSSILALQEPEISLDVKNQRLFREVLDEIVARGLVDQVLLESHVPTFDGAEVVRFSRRADGTTEVMRAAAVGEERSRIARTAKEQGAEQRWITRDGYTQIPDNMQRDLKLADGGHVWFVKGQKHWEAWPEVELDELFGVGDEGGRDG